MSTLGAGPVCSGTVVWFTSEQGGRRTGPPRPEPHGRGYAANGWLPPSTAGDGLRSLVVSDFDPDLIRSAATARWLVETADDPAVEPGSVLVVSEGPKPVGVFFVDAAYPAV